MASEPTQSRYRPFRFVVVAAFAVVALAALTAARHDVNPEQVTSGPTPGYSPPEGTVDTRPFNLAEPRTTGATTIPEGQGGSTSTTTTSPPPAPTTTIVPLPDPGDDPACQALVLVGETMRRTPISEEQATGSPPTDLPKVLLEAADLIQASGLPQMEPLVTTLRSSAGKLVDPQTFGAVRKGMWPLLRPTGPTAGSIAILADHTKSACPGLDSLQVS